MTGELFARFELAYPGGATIHAEFRHPAEGFSIGILFGPSGCGKTTLLRGLAGLERPGRGEIRFGGETWFDAESGVCLSPQARGIGYLAQDPSLFPHLSVIRNVEYGLRGLRAAERARLAGEMLERFGLGGLGGRAPRELSGGQRRRAALARALVRRPRLLLLDEPLSGLDAPLREGLRRELRRLLADFAIPVVLVTHDRVEAISLADRVTVLEGGRVRQAGPVDEVFARPSDPSVARIVGVETVERGRVVAVAEGLATVRIGRVELHAVAPEGPAAEVFACIRAEEVTLQRGEGAASSVRNRLPARILSVSPEGPLVRVLLDCGFPLTALVTRPSSEELRLAEGEAVTALIKAPAIHLIDRG